MKFEAHITCKLSDSEAVREVCEYTGWSYSQIDGDPIMGKQAYCYLTTYDSNEEILYSSMQEVCQILRSAMVEPLRQKIELIVFDSKTGVDVLGLVLPRRQRGHITIE